MLAAADNDRLAKSGALERHGCANDALIVAFSEHNAGLLLTRTRVDGLQNGRSRVEAFLQRLFIGFQIDNRAPRNAGIHTGTGHGGRNCIDQARIKRRRDDVIRTKCQLAPIGHCHFVGNVSTRQCGQRLSAGDFHFVVDRAGMDVKRTAEQVGKAEDVVHLIWIIGASGRNNYILAHLAGLFRCDFRIGIGHRKNHRVWCHIGNHFPRNSTLGRNAKEYIGVFHRLVQRAQVSLDGMRRFPLVHAFRPALIYYALGVANDAIIMARAHGFQQFDTGNTRGTGTVQDNLDVGNVFAGDFQRIDQSRRTNDGGSVLIVVEHRNVHLFLQRLFDDETFWRFDILKIDAPKAGAHQLDRSDDRVRIFGIQFDIDSVNIGEPLEQRAFAFHHRFGCERTKVSHPQNGRSVGNDGNHVALGGIIVCSTGVVSDGLYGNGNARRIRKAKVALRRHRDGRVHFQFSGRGVQVIG